MPGHTQARIYNSLPLSRFIWGGGGQKARETVQSLGHHTRQLTEVDSSSLSGSREGELGKLFAGFSTWHYSEEHPSKQTGGGGGVCASVHTHTLTQKGC